MTDQSLITCPQCHTAKLETMPTDACWFFYECSSCGALLRPGLRASEVVSLKLTDIDRDRMLIRVEQGKGKKDRYVILSPLLLEILHEWWRVARKKGWMSPGQPWLFPGYRGQHTSARQLHRIVRLAAGRAGITKRVGVHTLRHCFATHLLEQKTDIRIIQVLLGHKKLDTTALYTRVAISTIGQVTSPLDFLRKMPG